MAITKLTSYSWNGPIVLHVAFSPDEWKRGENSGESFSSCGLCVWQHPDVAFKPFANKGPLCELRCATKSHPPDTRAHTHTHTHAHTRPAWYRWHYKPRASHDRHTLNLWPYETNFYTSPPKINILESDCVKSLKTMTWRQMDETDTKNGQGWSKRLVGQIQLANLFM